jgi:hypothetical protein
MKIKFGVAALAAAALLAGCGGGGGNDGGNNFGNVVGTWRQVSLGVPGTSVTCPNRLIVNGVEVDSCGPNEIVVIRSNGTMEYNEPATVDFYARRDRGTWSFTNGVLTVTATETAIDSNEDGQFTGSEIQVVDPPVALATNVSFSGDRMTFSYNNDGARIDVWQRQ